MDGIFMQAPRDEVGEQNQEDSHAPHAVDTGQPLDAGFVRPGGLWFRNYRFGKKLGCRGERGWAAFLPFSMFPALFRHP
ncbi:MAG: hypothetical protein WBV23_08755 [Desulfobaccales bacterium]